MRASVQVICVELSRSWAALVVLLRPLAFGRPIEVEHVPTCGESVSIMLVTTLLASCILYGLSRLARAAKANRVSPLSNLVAQGLGSSAAFMWAGAAFSPMVSTCFQLVTMHRTLALAFVVSLGAAVSVLLILLQARMQEWIAATHVQAAARGRLVRKADKAGSPLGTPDRQATALGGDGSTKGGGKVMGANADAGAKADTPAAASTAASAAASTALPLSPALVGVIAIAIPLVSVFVVISVAAVVDKAVGLHLAWRSPAYIHAYVDGEQPPRERVRVSSTDAWLPNPALVSLLWALAVSGVLSRAASALTTAASTRLSSAGGAAAVLFLLKLCAYYTGFQYLSAIAIGWKVLLQDAGTPTLGVTALEALTVACVAALYIALGEPIAGLSKISGQHVVSREEAERSFHDTTIGQAIGVSFTPCFERAFALIVLQGGDIEARLWPAEGLQGSEAAAAAALYQDWEVAAGVLYVVGFVTPLSIWLYVALRLASYTARARCPGTHPVRTLSVHPPHSVH